MGGGAVEFYTGSAVMTGDIDVTSPVQPELEEELRKLGFIRPSGPPCPALFAVLVLIGRRPVYVVNPEFMMYELVSPVNDAA